MPGSKSSIDHRDIYYRLTKSSGYRARSAFKLLHLDEEFGLFEGVSTAVDLCAAPGSWSQVLSQKLADKLQNGTAKVVSLDLQPMAPLKDVTTLQTDITLPSTVPLVLNALGGRKADLVVCDGAPDVTGVHDLDSYLHNQLLLAAFTLALTLMAPHATLIFKIFLSPMDPKGEMLRSQMRPFFTAPPGQSPTHLGEALASGSGQPEDRRGQVGFDLQGRRGGVWVRKPRSSRQGSSEAFLVCRNFDPSTVPLSQTYSAEALAQLTRQTKGTLALDTLATLCGGQADLGGAKWDALRRWVGSGDLRGLTGSERQAADSAVVPSAQADSAVSTASVPPPAASSSAEPSGAGARERRRSRPFPASLDLGTDMTPIPMAYRRLPDRGASVDSLSPASAFGTSPTLFLQDGIKDREKDRGWARIAPSPLPSPLYPPEGASNGILAGPSTVSGGTEGPFRGDYTLGARGTGSSAGVSMAGLPVTGLGFALTDPTASAPSSSLSPSRDEPYLSSAAFTPRDSGAVSPALSTSSKTDLFFATDLSVNSLAGGMSSDLPRPPKPLSHSNSIGHGWPRGPSHREGQFERDRRVTMPSTPTRTAQESLTGQVTDETELPGLKMDSPALRAQEDENAIRTLGESSKTAALFRSASARERWRTASLPDRAIRTGISARSGPSPLILPGGSPLASGSISIFANDLPSPTEQLPHQSNPLSPVGPGPSSSLNVGPTPSRRLRDDEARRSGGGHLTEGHAKRPSMERRGESALAREEQRGGSSEPGGSVQQGDIMGPEGEGDQTAPNGQGPRRWGLVRKLGEGAFSAVWLADRVSTDVAERSPRSTTAVAIKLTSRTLCISNDRTRISFLREVSVLRQLTHPNIVGFVDSFSTRTHHCLCIEQLGGGELFEVLEKRGGLMYPRNEGGEELVRRMFSELCEAVGWLHDVEVVHRDIKLENILLTMDPFDGVDRDSGNHRLAASTEPLIKLTDFGLARFIPSPPASPMLRTRCGSESFAAPEIIMGREYDGRDTDSWACGVVLYAMITGQLPFDDEPTPPSNPVSAIGSAVLGGTPTASTPGRNRGWSVSSVGSTSSAVEEKERRRKMLKIAKGQYTWPDGVAPDNDARRVVDMLLVRDPQRRVRVGDLRPSADGAKPSGWVMDLGQASKGLGNGSRAMHGGRQVGKGWIMDDEREEGLYGDIE